MGRRDLARRRTGRSTKLLLANRLRFETLLSTLSAGLIHVSAPDTGVAIERALQQVVTFLDVDRGGLDEHAEGRPRLRLSWARPGLEEPSQVTAADQFPWVSGRLREGELVRFSRLAELPEAAVTDRVSFERVGTRSKVLIPLRAGGPILGVLSFGSVRTSYAWSDDATLCALLWGSCSAIVGCVAYGNPLRREPNRADGRAAPCAPGGARGSRGRRLRAGDQTGAAPVGWSCGSLVLSPGRPD